jgi:hypothetical protein
MSDKPTTVHSHLPKLILGVVGVMLLTALGVGGVLGLILYGLTGSLWGLGVGIFLGPIIVGGSVMYQIPDPDEPFKELPPE